MARVLRLPKAKTATPRLVLQLIAILVIVSLTPNASLAAQPAPLSGKQLRELKLYIQSPTGELSLVPREVGFANEEATRDFPTSVATPQTVVETVRLPGTKAKVRFTQGQPIEIFAEMPFGSDPRQLELFHFGIRGKQRVTYIEPFRNPNRGMHWNTISFRAGLLKDGRWNLMPPTLAVGEYCFSPHSSHDSFCFGVDPK